MSSKSKSPAHTKKHGLKQWLYAYSIPLLVFSIALFAITFFIPLPHYETTAQKVNYETNYREDKSLAFGERKYLQAGTDGQSIVNYKSNRSIFDLLFRKDSIKKVVVSTKIIKQAESRIVFYGSQKTTDTKPSSNNSSTPSSTNVPRPTGNNCSDEYYKNTKVFQEFWRYHLDTAQGHINEVNKQDYLTPDEKKEQINRWARNFNANIEGLVAIWKKSMNDSGCGSTPMGFSPGYMPVE